MNKFEEDDMVTVGFNAYRLWLSMRNYWNIEKIRYGAKSNVKEATYLKRKDRKMFYRLSQRYGKELENFLISVYARVGNDKLWVGTLLQDDYDKEFTDWQRRTAVPLRSFKQDVMSIAKYCADTEISLKQVFQSNKGKLPAIVQFEAQKYITPESLVIINRLTKFTDHIYPVHPSWSDIKLRLTKYDHFVKIGELRDYATVLRDGTTNLPTN